MAEKQIFETEVIKDEKSEGTGIYMPFDVEQVFGAKRVPVIVSVNGVQYRSTIVRMGGNYCLGFPKKFREEAGIQAGQTISVEIEKDTEKRTVEIPEDFAAALKKAGVSDVFSKMSYTHQKEYVLAVTEAKKAETRTRRIEKNIEILKKK